MRRIYLFGLVFMLCGALMAEEAGGEYRQRVGQMSRAFRRQLARRDNAPLTRRSLDHLREAIPEEAVRARIEEVFAVGSLGISARTYDESGRAGIHRYLLRHIGSLEAAGVVHLGSIRGVATVPVLSKPATLQLGEASWEVYPVWSNGVLPSATPEEGLRAPLVHAGDGTWESLRGLEMKGRIAILETEGAEHWERLFSLGAQAVIFLEDDTLSREKAERFFCNTPVPMPRFYAAGAQAESLRAAVTNMPTPGAEALLRGGSRNETRPFETIFAYLPPSEPMTYHLSPTDLLQRIADDYAVPLEALMALNNLEPGDHVSAGDRLLIPGTDDVRYTVAEQDLLARIAADMDVTPASLQALNGGRTLEEVWSEDTAYLRIPNLAEPLVLMTTIDAVSAVPDLPHGGRAAANIAIQLLTMDYLASADHLYRRRPVLFVFLDAEALGGLGSRTFAESVMLARYEDDNRAPDGLSPSVAIQDAGTIEEYREARRWFADPQTESIADDKATWLAQQWLMPKVEARRVWFAEQRAFHLRAARAARYRDPDADVAEDERQVQNYETLIAVIADPSTGIRLPLEQRGTIGVGTLRAFLAGLDDAADAHPELGLTSALLEAQLNAEYREIVTNEERLTKNKDAARTVMAVLQPAPPSDRKDAPAAPEATAPPVGNATPTAGLSPKTTHFANRTARGWFLSLSDGTPHLSVTPRGGGWKYGSLPAMPQLNALALRLRDIVAYTHVTGDWDTPWAFVTEHDSLSFPISFNPSPPIYVPFWTVGNVVLAPFTTINDRLDRLDTPLDTPDRLHVGNLTRQLHTLLAALTHSLEVATDSAGPNRVARPAFGRLVGKTLQFNIRSGIDAQEPVPGVHVYYPAIAAGESPNPGNSNVYLGTRLGILRTTLLNGAYAMPLETVSTSIRNHIYAYRINPATGLVDMVMDEAQIGSAIQTPAFRLLNGQDTEKSLIMTSVYPYAFFPGSDPMNYRTIGQAGAGIDVTDAVTDGLPSHFGLDNPIQRYGETGVLSNILYMPPDRRVRLVVANTMFLIGRITERHPRGDGYPVGPYRDDEGRLHRNISLPLTPLHVARDMYHAGQLRYASCAEKNITSRSIQLALERAERKLAEAERAVAERDWQAVEGASRESWGILVRFYPRIMTLRREAVFSIIVLMGLLLPCAAFIERLLIGSKTIIARIVYTTILFTIGMGFLRLYHPALQIIDSAFIILVAFVMILMSVVVLSISYQRFDILVRRARAAGGEVEGETISLASSLNTALSLGVSNLKKRLGRTFLTAFTVTALTFSIVAFVSVSGSDSVHTVPIHRMDPVIEDIRVDPLDPAYEGVMFRDFVWRALPQNFVSAIRSEFGRRIEHPYIERLKLAQRGFYIQVEGGNNAAREGFNQIEVRRLDTGSTSILRGLMGFEPAETDFSALDRAVNPLDEGGYAQGWFVPEDRGIDRFRIILPSRAADELGIRTSDLVDDGGNRKPESELPLVVMLNNHWRVIGILDEEYANRIRDVNGKSLSMVDHLASAISSGVSGHDITQEPPSTHLNWTRLGVIPYAAMGDVDGRPRSVAIRFPTLDDPDVQARIAKQVATGRSETEVLAEAEASLLTFRELFFDDIALRVNRAMFGVKDGGYSLITTQKRTSIGGLAQIVVPVILCILIVLNTMMGNVDERKGEVGMLGAIGLSPSQISFLLLSESLVFSILGIVFGTFAGLLFAAVTSMLGVTQALSFNFTSLMAVGLGMGTGVVVLLATLIPARRAAVMAAPSGMVSWELPAPSADNAIRFTLPFTLTRGNAVGMMAFFRQFLLNHSEATSEDFNCRDVGLALHRQPDALEVHCQMWLAPYDLDVAQRMVLQVHPTENEGVFRVDIALQRTSGSEEAWVRTNYAFMDLVRYQFLLWRNLDDTVRHRYVGQGAHLFKDAEVKA